MKAAHKDTAAVTGRPLDIIRPDDGDPRHGTPNGYSNLLCKCDPCTAAHTEYRRELRQRRREALAAG